MGYFADHRTGDVDLFGALPDGAALVDDAGLIRDANGHLSDLTGFATRDLLGRDVRTVVPDYAGAHSRDIDAGRAWARVSERPVAIVCADGVDRCAEVVVAPLRVDDQPWFLLQVRKVHPAPGAGHDAGHDARGRGLDPADATLFRATSSIQSEQFRLAFEVSMAPMVFSDKDGRFLAVNGAFCKMCGRDEEELLGRDATAFTFPDDVATTEEVHRLIRSGTVDEHRYGKRFVHKNGRIVFAEVSICCARDASGEARYYVSSVRDVTEERALSAQLSFQALHDPLTGLANRALFEDHLSQARSRAEREQKIGAVLLGDLDDFKEVNDTYGHLVGDQLLIEIANRFKQVTRTSDTLCRFGGDEFLYLAEGLSHPDEAQVIARRLLATLDAPFVFGDIRVDQKASIGVVVWRGDDPDDVELVQKADAAMYEAKRRGHGHIALFTPQMGRDAVNHLSLVQELQQALTSGDMEMHYQPIIDLTSSSIVGFEALMRWHHRDRGWIPPDVFIPLAEQHDLIVTLGEFALRTALSAASTWEVDDAARGYPYVTVNLSAQQFHDPGLVTLIQNELERSGVAPERLILEVTEGVALVDIAETLSVMERLNHLNVGIALDDFGTGYSSLSYLAALNPKIIKIDQSFVRPTHDR
nr:EAL domain-containing protein [Acidobacteriota bacterium]